MWELVRYRLGRRKSRLRWSHPAEVRWKSLICIWRSGWSHCFLWASMCVLGTCTSEQAAMKRLQCCNFSLGISRWGIRKDSEENDLQILEIIYSGSNVVITHEGRPWLVGFTWRKDACDSGRTKFFRRMPIKIIRKVGLLEFSECSGTKRELVFTPRHISYTVEYNRLFAYTVASEGLHLLLIWHHIWHPDHRFKFPESS